MNEYKPEIRLNRYKKLLTRYRFLYWIPFIKYLYLDVGFCYQLRISLNGNLSYYSELKDAKDIILHDYPEKHGPGAYWFDDYNVSMRIKTLKLAIEITRRKL